MYAVGAAKTPRKNLRELLSVRFKVSIPIMTILCDNNEERLNKDMKQEIEP